MNLNDYLNKNEINYSTVKRGDQVFHDGSIHTVVNVARFKGGGAGMGEYPPTVTVSCNTGLVIRYNPWCKVPAEISEEAM